MLHPANKNRLKSIENFNL